MEYSHKTAGVPGSAQFYVSGGGKGVLTMRDGDITIKSNRELLAELLDISEDVFETLTLREIMMTP
ncbi:MAG: hypothetical protein IIZ87_04725, partial [Selenomonas sp.]|nr:hypothetical protein [Selenomonas sp.]